MFFGKFGVTMMTLKMSTWPAVDSEMPRISMFCFRGFVINRRMLLMVRFLMPSVTVMRMMACMRIFLGRFTVVTVVMRVVG